MNGAGDLLGASTRSRTDVRAFLVLADGGGPMSAREVARKVSGDPSNVGRMLLRLEERGLVARELVERGECPVRRLYLYQLTEDGRSAAEELRGSPVVGRLSDVAVDVLDTLASATVEVGTVFLVEDTGRPWPCVRHAVRRLVQRGLVRQRRTGRHWRYRITEQGRKALEIVERRSS